MDYTNTQKNAIPQSEEERLEALEKYNFEEIAGQKEFMSLTKIAAQICHTPMAAINFVGHERMWSIGSYGIGFQDIAREESACQFTVAEGEFVEFNDLLEHSFFKDHAAVVNSPHLRYYAGVPLNTSSGHNIGTLCVYDDEDKKLDPWQVDSLKILADEVIARLDLILGQKKLQEINQQKNDMLQIISHDMRNPLSGIIGIANLVGTNHCENDDELKKFMHLIEQNAEHLLQHVNELMDVSFLESGTLELNPSPIDVKEVVSEAVGLHQAAAKVKQIKLSTDFKITEKKGRFDKVRLEQVLGNLITNAIKFTDEGGAVYVRVLYPVEPQNEQINKMHIEVEDNGIGMPEEFVDILFTKYGDHGRLGTSGEKSIGLGLPILKQLVDAHGGTIDIETEEGAGTKFTVLLPDIGTKSG